MDVFSCKNVYLISIEGCDGVGKTTLIDLLKLYYKNTTNISFIKSATNVEIDQVVVNYRKETSYDPIVHMYLEVLSTFVTMLDTYEELEVQDTKTKKIIILDRYWYTLLVYTNILASQNVDDYIVEKILPKPDLVIYISCNPETSYIRKSNFEPIESGHSYDNHFNNFCEFQSKIDREYRNVLDKYNQNRIEILSDVESQKQYLERIINIIDELKN